MFRWLAALPGIGKHKTVIASVGAVASIFLPGAVGALDVLADKQEFIGGYLGLGLLHKGWKHLRPGAD
jgi:hypothetical protein